MAGLRRGDLGGVGAVGTVPAPGIGGEVQVVPALPLTPVRASSGGGEGRGAGRVVEDIEMGGTCKPAVFYRIPASLFLYLYP